MKEQINKALYDLLNNELSIKEKIKKSFLVLAVVIRAALRFIRFCLPALIFASGSSLLWFFLHDMIKPFASETVGRLNDFFFLIYVLLATFTIDNALDKNQKMQGAINKASENIESNPTESKRQEDQFFSLLRTPIHPVLLFFIGVIALYILANCFMVHYETVFEGVWSIFMVSSVLLIYYISLLDVMDIFGGYWVIDVNKFTLFRRGELQLDWRSALVGVLLL